MFRASSTSPSALAAARFLKTQLARSTTETRSPSLTEEVLNQIFPDRRPLYVAKCDYGCQDLAETEVFSHVRECVCWVGDFGGYLTGELFLSENEACISKAGQLTLLLLSIEALMTGPIQYDRDSSKTV